MTGAGAGGAVSRAAFAFATCSGVRTSPAETTGSAGAYASLKRSFVFGPCTTLSTSILCAFVISCAPFVFSATAAISLDSLALSLRSQLRNVGWAEGRYNLARLAAAGLTVPHVWIDVEHYSIRPWSSSRLDNRALVRGVVRAYQDAGVATGFYSTSLQWGQIVGSTRWSLPEWHTAGPTGRATALARCAEDI